MPKETILSLVPEDHAELCLAFNLKFIRPKSGDKLKAINFVQENAKVSIERKCQEKQYKRHLLEDIEELFQIDNPIKRIEVYDNSHIMGAHAVGAMIVATEDGFSKKHYRKYNIKTTDIGDDYAMMKEVLTRRLANLQEEVPDLLLIDGGDAHLSVGQEILDHLGLNILKFYGMKRIALLLLAIERSESMP